MTTLSIGGQKIIRAVDAAAQHSCHGISRNDTRIAAEASQRLDSSHSVEQDRRWRSATTDPQTDAHLAALRTADVPDDEASD
jgi:hypothetical protein